MDDIVVAHSDDKLFDEFRSKFCARFRSKYLGKLDWFLGMAIYQHSDGSIEFDQQKYIEDMVHKFAGGDIQSFVQRDTPALGKTFDKLT